MISDPGVRPPWPTADPERLLSAGRTLNAVAEELDRMAGSLDRAAQAMDSTWRGRASMAFVVAWTERRRELAAQAVTYREAAGRLNGLAWALQTAKREHARLIVDAATEGVVLLPDGSVAGPVPLVMLAGPSLRRRAASTEAEVVAVDQHTAGALHRLALQDEVARPGATPAALPALLQAGVGGAAPNIQTGDGELRPELVAAWFAALSPAERRRLLRIAPALLGGLDGVPAAIRDQANRRLVASALAATSGRLAASREELATLRTRTAAMGFPSRSLAEEDRLLTEIAALEVREGALANLSRLPAGKFILVFDPRGQGRAAIAVGDVTTATDIGVLVPGTSTTLDNLDVVRSDAERLQGRAAQVLAKEGRDDAPVAVVAWLDYDAPDEVFPNAIDSSYAYAGAPTLKRFVDGLRAAGPDSHITVVGHSYGSTLTGIAGKQGLDADDVVFVGSPGVKANNVGELGLPEGAMVWAARGHDDEIWKVFPLDRTARSAVSGLNAGVDGALGLDAPDLRLPESHGPDPSLPAFGANRFGVDPDGDHSAYYKPDSMSFTNIAKIIAGTGEVTRA
jgi:hypothetical protein